MKRSLKLSEITDKGEFIKVNFMQLLAFAMGAAGTVLAYLFSDRYLDRLTLVGIFLVLQILIALIMNKVNPIGSSEISANRFILAFYLPVTLAPLACLYLDKIHLKKIENVVGIIEDKRIKRGGGKYSGGERKILTIRTGEERIEESVLWSFYDLVKVGDTVGLDIEKGLIGFRKVSEYTKL